MFQRTVPLALLLLVPALGRAQAAPERVLPAQSQVFLRYDGMTAHRPAFARTTAGKLLEGELGVFLAELGKYAVEVAQLAAQKDPQIGPWLVDSTRLVTDLYQNGLAVGVELERVSPPAAHAVVVFSGSGGETGAVLPLLQRIAEAGNAELKSVRIGKRFVHQVEGAPVQLGWWREGDDAVLYVGTEEPSAYARRVDEGKTGLASHPLHAQVAGFKEFETAARGYLDLPALGRVVGALSPEVARFVEELGLRDTGAITYVSGFDGLAQRAVTERATPGPRKGLFAMGSRKTLRLKELPKLPRDATSIYAATMDPGKGYEAVLQVVHGGVKSFAPALEDTVKEGIRTVEALLGVNLKADVFDNLGDVVVTYSAPSEGFLGLGALAALQVKDGPKLVESLEKMTRAAGFVPGLELTWKKQDYRGGQVLLLYLRFGQTTSLVGSFGLYKNWFLSAQFPQPIKGFLLRASGELPSWEADPKLTQVLAQLPGEYTALTIADPRPTMQGLLATTPFVLNLANTFAGQALPGLRPFDLTLVPHAQEVSQALFPNVTVVTDNGRVIRTDTRASIGLP